MKAITLNLLIEEQLARRAKARDPVKVTLAIGISLITCAVIAGSWLAGISMKRKSTADGLQSKLESLTAKQTTEEGMDTKSLRALTDQYVAISQSRRMLAPELALIKDMIPVTMQLNNIRLAITMEAPAAPPSSEDGEGKRRAKPKPVERVVLQMDGRVVCQRPEIEVDSFVQMLQTNEVYRDHFTEVKLRSIAKSGTATAPASAFVIDCQLKGKEPAK